MKIDDLLEIVAYEGQLDDILYAANLGFTPNNAFFAVAYCG